MEFIKKNVKLISIIIAVIIVIFIIILFTGNEKTIEAEGLISPSEVLHTSKFDVEILDYYQADFYYDEASSFDMYLGAELEFTNTTDEVQHVSALKSIRVEDSTGVMHQPVIDENYKVFGSELNPGETFYLPVSFAVDKSSEYGLYFNESLKDEDAKQQGFKLDGTNLELKDLPLTLEHKLERRESEESHE